MRILRKDELRSKARWAFDKTFGVDKVRRSPSSRAAQSTIISHSTLYKCVEDFIADNSTNSVPAEFPTHPLILTILNQQAKEQLLNTYKITIGPTMTVCFKPASHENRTVIYQSIIKYLRSKRKCNR